jgi:nicotinamidase-related amidase
MDLNTLMKNSAPFLQYVTEWESALPSLKLASLNTDPRQIAILSVDVINGFCHIGPLASPRVKGIIGPIVGLFERAHAAGVRHFILTQDTHEPDAVEFGQYAPHCVRGTEESEAVPEFKALPFYNEMITFPKNSIHSAMNTGLEDWLKEHPEVNTFIVVGDCTDLCTYQLAMHVRLRANANQLRQRVILPVDCVDTYDLPVETAKQIGAVPHDADLLHLVFLYHMMLNGVEVVRSLN